MADGSAVVSIEGTSVLVTTVCKPRLTGYAGFMPLTVDYRHKWSAAGRIPTNYHRRDLGPSEYEILTSRMIDRSIRPLFAKGFGHDVQLTCNVLALDSSNDPCVMAINAASASLALSDVPWAGPVAAVRLSYDDEKDVCLVNPTRRQLKNNPLNVVVTAAGGKRVIMIDGEADDLPPRKFVACLEVIDLSTFSSTSVR
uniref:Exoribonuclease phosphorolytic domain-containing protein n=1 Tax=Romanomermis culicivorax TaxID=13658 RepID=A0A915K7A1_ROMCU